MSFDWEQRLSWEDDDDDVGSADPADEDLENLTAQSASLELCNFLVDWRNRGSVSAKAICSIACLATHAGAVGSISDLSKKPGAQSGKYSLHVDRVVGLKPSESEEWLYLPLPQYQRWDGTRSIEQVATLAPHEQLAEEFAASHTLAA